MQKRTHPAPRAGWRQRRRLFGETGGGSSDAGQTNGSRWPSKGKGKTEECFAFAPARVRVDGSGVIEVNANGNTRKAGHGRRAAVTLVLLGTLVSAQLPAADPERELIRDPRSQNGFLLLEP